MIIIFLLNHWIFRMFSAFLFYVVVLVDSENMIVAAAAAANVAIPLFYFFIHEI